MPLSVREELVHMSVCVPLSVREELVHMSVCVPLSEREELVHMSVCVPLSAAAAVDPHRMCGRGSIYCQWSVLIPAGRDV